MRYFTSYNLRRFDFIYYGVYIEGCGAQRVSVKQDRDPVKEIPGLKQQVADRVSKVINTLVCIHIRCAAMYGKHNVSPTLAQRLRRWSKIGLTLFSNTNCGTGLTLELQFSHRFCLSEAVCSRLYEDVAVTQKEHVVKKIIMKISITHKVNYKITFMSM